MDIYTIYFTWFFGAVAPSRPVRDAAPDSDYHVHIWRILKKKNDKRGYNTFIEETN